MKPRLEQLDLKMLRVLMTLAQTQNTYRAADQLHLSQSAVSRSLGRLREVLDDPLFVRTNQGLEPTALTERMVARIPEVFDLISEVVEGSNNFDPAAWQGSASIALSTVANRCWGTPLLERLQQQAPNIEWSFQTWHASTVAEILDGRTSLGIHIENPGWPQSLYQQPLVEDNYVLMAKKGHEALSKKPHMKLFEQYPLVSLLLPDWNDYENRLESAIRATGVEPQINLRTDNMSLALDSLRKGRCLMAGTQALVDHLPDIDCVDYPREIEPPSANVMLCYPRRQRNSAKYRWLEEQTRAVLFASAG